MSAIPTVRVKSDAPGHQPAGFYLINESDFDPAVHQRFEEAPPAEQATDPAPASKAAKGGKKE